MINNKKKLALLPAYNAAKTPQKTFEKFPFDVVDEVNITDGFSLDATFSFTKKLGIRHTISHTKNKGYSANQNSCYKKALKLKADIIVMLHFNYHYLPKLIPAMCNLVANDSYDLVLGSRILSEDTLKGGMPLYKDISNRILTFIKNILINKKSSEYLTGNSFFETKILKLINFENNSADFVFDNEILSQFCFIKARIGEISCPANHFEEASSINFNRSITYGLDELRVSICYFWQKNKLFSLSLFSKL